MVEAASIRQAILAALPSEFSNFGQAPDLKHLYVPPAHVKALRLDCHLVIGTRGVGKSLWTAALDDAPLRRALGQSVPELEGAEARIGFSVAPCIEHYPDAATFANLLTADIPAYDIWRAVVARWIAGMLAVHIPQASWRETLDWLGANPEGLARLLQQASRHLADNGRFGLILFDALDRTSDDWRTMDRIVRDLLRAALWLKSYPRLSAKVFLREDQCDPTAAAFPDASKLLATRSELTWARHDLHGLLWQTLINGPDVHGERLREVYLSALGTPPSQAGERWLLSDEVKRETPAQRALFEALAGPWMGRDRRRGVPYLWSVGHLADGQGRTSPRSFLAAIRQAAEDTLERYPENGLALHYESIKRGIQKASAIRVDEIAEDYPWVRTFMNPLAGLTVPCEYALIRQRWEDRFPGGPGDVSSERLPPRHAGGGWDGIREDLKRLGLFETKQDGRVDMPDLYRVGFGLGRRGGVKPRSEP